MWNAQNVVSFEPFARVLVEFTETAHPVGILLANMYPNTFLMGPCIGLPPPPLDVIREPQEIPIVFEPLLCATHS